MTTRAISVGSVLLLALLSWLLVDGPRGSGGGEEAVGAGEPVRAKVLRVVDGDTIEVDLHGDEEDVRYIGVDTPETVKPGTPVQCFGPEASRRNHELVDGHTVRLEFDDEVRDRYGRMLAYVYADGKLVNAQLVAGGFARTLEIEPNTDMASALAKIEAHAAAAGRGLWGAC